MLTVKNLEHDQCASNMRSKNVSADV